MNNTAIPSLARLRPTSFLLTPTTLCSLFAFAQFSQRQYENPSAAQCSRSNHAANIFILFFLLNCIVKDFGLSFGYKLKRVGRIERCAVKTYLEFSNKFSQVYFFCVLNNFLLFKKKKTTTLQNSFSKLTLSEALNFFGPY